MVHQALILTEVDPHEQMITAAIFVNLSNESDRTLLPDLTNVGPGRFSFLRFSLPPLAEELDVQSDLIGGQIIPTGSGFAMTAPVTPGEHNISYSFRFPYQGNALSYKQSLLQGADVFQVLIPQRLSEIQVGTLEPMHGSLNAAGAFYLVWERADLAPGQGVEVELANLPRSNPLVPLGTGRHRRIFLAGCSARNIGSGAGRSANLWRSSAFAPSRLRRCRCSRWGVSRTSSTSPSQADRRYRRPGR